MAVIHEVGKNMKSQLFTLSQAADFLHSTTCETASEKLLYNARSCHFEDSIKSNDS